jgi:hypothetical protein
LNYDSWGRLKVQLEALPAELARLGAVKWLSGSAAGVTTTIYTVPAGKTFYLTSASLAGYLTAAGTGLARLELYDGVNSYPLLYVYAEYGTYYGHTALYFGGLPVPEGWEIQVYSPSTALYAYATAQGVEV